MQDVAHFQGRIQGSREAHRINNFRREQCNYRFRGAARSLFANASADEHSRVVLKKTEMTPLILSVAAPPSPDQTLNLAFERYDHRHFTHNH